MAARDAPPARVPTTAASAPPRDRAVCASPLPALRETGAVHIAGSAVLRWPES
eukprot:COSAG06_NODE_51033_length_314_cov_2.130233_1_plen_52_part_10